MITKNLPMRKVAKLCGNPKKAANWFMGSSRLTKDKGLDVEKVSGLLNDTLQKIMDENPGPLEELLGGKEKVFGFFVGKMMRELKGKASPDAVREALVKEVERRKNL